MAVVLLALICMTGRSVQAAETSEPHLSFKVSSDTFAESISGKWKTDKKGKRYLYEDQTYPKNVWLKINNGYYYFNKEGYVRTGKVKYKGATYYLSVRSENQWKDLLFFSKDWADGYRMDEDWQI